MGYSTWDSLSSGLQLDLAQSRKRTVEWPTILVCPKQMGFLGYRTFRAKSQGNRDEFFTLHPDFLLAGPGVGSNCVSFSKGHGSYWAALPCSYTLQDLVISLSLCNTRSKGNNCFLQFFLSQSCTLSLINFCNPAHLLHEILNYPIWMNHLLPARILTDVSWFIFFVTINTIWYSTIYLLISCFPHQNVSSLRAKAYLFSSLLNAQHLIQCPAQSNPSITNHIIWSAIINKL